MAGLLDQLYGDGNGILPYGDTGTDPNADPTAQWLAMLGDQSHDQTPDQSWLETVGATPQGIQTPYGDQQTADQQQPDQQDQGGGILAQGGPPAATAPQGFAPGAMPQSGGGGLLSNISDRLTNPLVLMGLGLASGRTPQEGFAGATRGLLAGQQLAQTRQNQQALYTAAINQGVDPQTAAAIATNPQAAGLLTPKIQMMTDAFGNQVPYAIHPLTGKITPLTMGGTGGASAASGGQMPGFDMAATTARIQDLQTQGVPQEDIIKQTVPAPYQGYISALLRGDAVPSNLGRVGGQAKQTLMDLAHSIDPTFSEQSMNARRTFVTEAAKATPNSIGGRINSGNTALQHQEVIAQKINDLGNWDLGGIVPGVASGINWLRQQGTADQKAKANALNDAVERYVDEVKKFYAGSNTGGVAERDAARARFNATKTPQELWAALNTERELMAGGLNSLQDQRDQVFGGNTDLARKAVGDIIRPQTKTAIERTAAIQHGGAASPAARQPAIPAAATSTPSVAPAPALPGTRPSRAEIEAEMRRRGLLQ